MNLINEEAIKYQQTLEKILAVTEKDPTALNDAFQLARQLENVEEVSVEGHHIKHGEHFRLAHEYNKLIRRKTAQIIKSTGDVKALELNARTILFDAPYDFDCYCRYLEWNRPPEKKFYEPRRSQLRPLADALQLLADGKLDLLALSLPPGVGKTTLAIFFLTYLAGRDHTKPMLCGSHSNAFLRGVYDEFLRVLDPEGEYLWGTIFPELSVIKTNAKDLNIDVGTNAKRAKRFATLELTSIGSGNAGKVRAEQLLYCDDLVSGIEEALSRERMDNLWSKYVTDLRQRKIGSCRELHIATRWSVNDPIGRLELAYGDTERAKFIRVPAMDENDESNFNYSNGVGFTTAFYREQREIMDDASWRALYMNEPIEREGILFHEAELRRFMSLPEQEPDAVLSVCDTKDKGVDYCVMPICYQYGSDFYLVDCICDSSTPDIVEKRIVEKMMTHRIQMSRFESNAAGGRVAEDIQEEVKRRGGVTQITTKYSTANKETRIIVTSGWIKDHVLFQADKYVKKDKEYRTFLNYLCSWTMTGKNKHDDVPDALSMFADFIQTMNNGRVEIIKRPF